MQVSGCCSAVPGRSGGSYKGFFCFFVFLAEGVRNLYALSFLDKLFIEEQFTVNQNMCALHENVKKMGSRILRRFLEKKM